VDLFIFIPALLVNKEDDVRPPQSAQTICICIAFYFDMPRNVFHVHERCKELTLGRLG